jgi:tRNA pseudouridine55 synthase
MSLSGAICVLKPPGMTSFDVISFIRKQLNIKKAGHAGTLDPSAAGVLPVFTGKATKSVDDFSGGKKRYIAEIEFGFCTNTCDKDGEITNTFNGEICLEDIDEVLEAFKGKQKQIPPMHSAVKINGKKLYKLAHKGKEVERPSRDIEVFDISVMDRYDNKVLLNILCSKGTYIRSLSHDIGIKTGYFATLGFLLRTGSGIFKIEDACTLEEIEKYKDSPESILIKPDDLYKNIDKIKLSEKDYRMIFNGMTIPVLDIKTEGIKGIMDNKGALSALGMVSYRGKKYYLKKIREF